MKMSDDSKKVIDALSKKGIIINDIYDLVNTSVDYSAAVPILIELLKGGISNDKVKEGIIRALAVKSAKKLAGTVLIEEFHKIPIEKKMLRWAIGNTMATIVDESDTDGILNIISNKQNGTARQMFIIALGKIKSLKAENCLINLLDDDEIAPHVLEALGKLKSEKAKNKIIALLDHPKPLIRKEARKAINRIENK